MTYDTPEGTAADVRRTRGAFARFVRWKVTRLITPGFWYLVGAVLAVGLAFLWHNPERGQVSHDWPWVVLRNLWEGRGPALHADYALVLLGVAALLLLAAAMAQPGRARAVVILVVTGLAAALFVPQTAKASLLLLAGGCIVGALMPGPLKGQPAGRWGLLWFGVGVLAVLLWLPSSSLLTRGMPGYGLAWQEGPGSSRTLFEPVYEEIAIARRTVDELAAAPTLDDALEVLRLGWTVVAALLLGAVGLLAGLGLGGRWARWVATTILWLVLVGCVAGLWVDSHHLWIEASLVPFVGPLAAAIGELVGPDPAPAPRSKHVAS